MVRTDGVGRGLLCMCVVEGYACTVEHVVWQWYGGAVVLLCVCLSLSSFSLIVSTVIIDRIVSDVTSVISPLLSSQLSPPAGEVLGAVYLQVPQS